MERIPILKMGPFLLVTIQVDMHDRLAIQLQDDLTERIAHTGAHGVLIDISAHGSAAAGAAETAAGLFERHVDRVPIVGVMEMLHAGLRSTRGAAAVIAEIRSDPREVRYVGVGNISATIVSGTGVRNLVSHNGTVGHQARRIQEFVYPWHRDDACVVVHADHQRAA